MEMLFEHRLASARTGAARTRVWLGVLADTVTGAAREWGRTMTMMRGGDGMQQLGTDLRQAIRGLMRTPAAAVIAGARTGSVMSAALVTT